MTPLDPQTRAIQRRLCFDTPFWAGGVTRGPKGEVILPDEKGFQGVARIVNKRAKLVPCVANSAQIELDDALERQRAEGKPMRAIVLKARKRGISTWVALKFLQRLTQIEYQFAVVCAQDTDTAGLIHTMAQRAYSHLPTEDALGLGFPVKPALIGAHFSAAGRKYMEFGEPTRQLRMEGRTGSSVFEIDTARTPESGRGSTPTMLHLSEVARWEGESAARKTIALLNAVPSEPETIVVLESTANGLNHYYRRYTSARDGAADPDTGESYVALFVPWWQDPDLRNLFSSDAERERFASTIGDTHRYGEVAEDEPALVELYACTPEQLFWRRQAIRTQHENNVSLFKQEYPASDEEAFIGSGRTVFSGILVAKTIRAAQEAPEPVSGSLRPGALESRKTRRGTVEIPVSALWVPSGEMQAGMHELRVWEQPSLAIEAVVAELPPAPTASSGPEQVAAYAALLAAAEGAHVGRGPGAYVVAADVAEGEANTFTEGDFHCATVYDHHTFAQVAVHVSRMDLHELPHWLFLLGLYYNTALLAVEVNGPGVAVVDTLHKDMRYPRIYQRKRIDRLANVTEKKPGWQTDRATKRALEVTFGQAMAEDRAGIRDLATARELSTYVIDEKGRTGALYGEHDDRLLASMIAHRVMETERPRAGGKRRKRSEGDPITGYRAGYDEWDPA